MKIIYLYIAKKFWPPFFFALGVFCVVALMGDVFENLKTISDGSATFRYVLKYALLRLPYWSGMLIPLACMLASIFTVTEMVSSGEWTAAVAGGYRPWQLFTPIICCVIFVSILSFLNQEYVTPVIEQKSEIVYQRRLKGQKDFKAEVQKNITLKMPGNRMLFAKEVESKAGRMTDITMDAYDAAWAIESQVVAHEFVYENGRWVFKDGVERTFGKDTGISEVKFTSKEAPYFTTAPKQIIVGEISESNISLKDLNRKIKFLNRSGLVNYKERTFFHNRLAMPITTLLMCMLTMPFAIVVRKKSKALNIIIALVLAFGFWSLSSLAVTAGESGMLSPLVAAWGLCGICAIVVFVEYRVMKI